MTEPKGGAIVRYDNHPVEDDQTRLDILDALLAGKTFEEVGLELGYHRVEVQKAAGFLGWPTVAYTQRSRDALAERIARGSVVVAEAGLPKPQAPKSQRAPRVRRAVTTSQKVKRGTPEGRSKQAEGARRAHQRQTERLESMQVTIGDVRAWAKANDYRVSAHAPLLSSAVLDAYKEAHA